MTPRPWRLIKVGGSLLGWNGLAAATESWLGRQTPAVNIFVAGGGELADVIRRADAVHHLGEEAAHWLCVDALSISAQLLGELLSLPVVTRRQELPDEFPSACVFDPAPFMHDLEHRQFPTPLPHVWSVTSDSIAARIGDHLAASEFVLLKSCLPGAGAADYVDDFFSVAAANLPSIRCVNFRSPDFEEIPWIRDP